MQATASRSGGGSTQHALGSLARVVVVVAACVMVSVVVFRETRAAFNDTTSNAGNAFDAGTVVIADNDSGTAMLGASGMTPGDSDTSCIEIDYTGSLAAAVKMYGSHSAAGTDLAPYLTVDIDLGTGAAGFDDCTGFNKSGDLYNGTLSNFTTTYTDWASGLAVWSPAGAESRSLRFVVTLADDNNAQGADVDATFTWEAQNT